MNEYFFEYKVLDNNERESKAVKFVADRKYNGEGGSIAIYVIVPAWNYGKLSEQIPAYYVPGLDQCGGFKIFHNPSDGRLYESSTTKRDYFEQTSDFMAELRIADSKNYTAFGKIVFIGSDGNPQEVFHYVLKYGKRVKIPYTVTYSSSKAEFRLTHPEFKEEIPLVAVTDASGVPIRTDTAYTTESVGSIKKGAKNTRLTANCSAGSQARLRFADKNQFGRYLLVCQSAQKEGGKRFCEITPKNNKCPYCFSRIAPLNSDKQRAKLFSHEPVSCDGKKTVDRPVETTIRDRDARPKRRLFCGNMYGENDSADAGRDVLRYVLLPDKYEKQRNAIIGVIGTPSSGKSVYLSTLFDLTMAGREGDSTSAKNRTVIADTFLQPALGTLTDGKIGIYKQQTLGQKSDTETLYLDTRFWESAFSGYLEGMVLAAGKKVADATNRSVGDKLTQRFHPFVCRVGQRGSAYFYDTSGEAATGRQDADTEGGGGEPIIKNADYYILVINTEISRLRETKHILDKITEVDDKDLYSKPLAVVVTKFDKDEANIDPSAACLRTDVLDMLSCGSFEGSELETNIRVASEEVESYLKTIEGYGLIKTQLEKFGCKTFFNCSALTDPASITSEKPQKLLYRLSPTRVEVPVIWLLYQAGLID